MNIGQNNPARSVIQRRLQNRAAYKHGGAPCKSIEQVQQARIVPHDVVLGAVENVVPDDRSRRRERVNVDQRSSANGGGHCGPELHTPHVRGVKSDGAVVFDHRFCQRGGIGEGGAVGDRFRRPKHGAGVPAERSRPAVSHVWIRKEAHRVAATDIFEGAVGP